jgi:hypothetical protein
MGKSISGLVAAGLPLAAEADPEARHFLMICPAAIFIVQDLSHSQRPGTHKARLTAEDVDELGKLVLPSGAQAPSHPGDAVIVLCGLLEPEFLVGVWHHGAELVDLEAGATPAPSV